MEAGNTYNGLTNTYTADITVSSTGIEDVEFNGMGVFPNPSNGNFDLNFQFANTQDITVNIYNVQGQLVYNELLNDFSGAYTKSLSLEDLGAGLYNLQVVGESTVLSQRIVVQ